MRGPWSPFFVSWKVYVVGIGRTRLRGAIEDAAHLGIWACSITSLKNNTLFFPGLDAKGDWSGDLMIEIYIPKRLVSMNMLRRNIRKTLRNFAVAVNVAFDPGPEA